MDIIIQSLGFNAGSSLKEFIRNKVSSLKADNIVRANVTLFKEATADTENDYCEIRLEVPGNDHFVKKNSQYFETSVSECVDVLSQMIKKTRDKQNDARQAEASNIQDALLEGEETDEDVELEDVVK